jgi:hypothetical protein
LFAQAFSVRAEISNSHSKLPDGLHEIFSRRLFEKIGRRAGTQGLLHTSSSPWWIGQQLGPREQP